MRCVLLSSAVILAAAAGLLAQAGAPRADTSKQNLCTVAGRVVTAADGTPLKSAQVMLMEENARREPKSYAARSDGSGNFILKEVAPGRYRMLASHPGYLSEQYHSDSADSGAVLALAPRQQVDDILFRMTLAAVVTGRISDEDAEPMAGVQVLALRKPSEEEQEDNDAFDRKPDELLPAGSARTDDRGQYRIYGLKPGDYYLRASDSQEPLWDVPAGQEYLMRQSLGTEYAPVYYPGVLQRSQAEAVSLRPGDEAQIDFSMRHIKTVELSGRVVAPDGKPAIAMVDLQEAADEEYASNPNTSTEADGKFRMKGVAPGSYILTAYEQNKDGPYRPAARQKIQVGNENLDSIVIALTRGSDFSGRVTVEGVAGPNHMFISLSALGGEVWNYGARVKPDGSFEIAGVQEGSYAIAVYGGNENTSYIKSARLGSEDILEHGMQVETGTGGTIEVVITAAGGRIEGSVTQDDKAAVGARVRIFPDPETPYNRMRRRSTTTDQNGQFVLPGIAPGKYRVTAISPRTPGSEVTKAEPQSVTVAEREQKTVQLKLVRPHNQ